MDDVEDRPEHGSLFIRPAGAAIQAYLSDKSEPLDKAVEPIGVIGATRSCQARMDTASPDELPICAVSDLLSLLKGACDSEDCGLSEGIELLICDIRRQVCVAVKCG